MVRDRRASIGLLTRASRTSKTDSDVEPESDVGEETDSSDHSNPNADDDESDQDDVDDQIVQDIEKWKSEARATITVVEGGTRGRNGFMATYTKWKVISQSKHNLVKTFHYTRMPDPDEPKLDRLLRAGIGF